MPAASRWAGAGRGGQARPGVLGGDGGTGSVRGSEHGTPVAVPTWRRVLTRPVAIPARAGCTAESAAEARPVEVIPRPISARMRPGSSTSQMETALRPGTGAVTDRACRLVLLI